MSVLPAFNPAIECPLFRARSVLVTSDIDKSFVHTVLWREISIDFLPRRFLQNHSYVVSSIYSNSANWNSKRAHCKPVPAISLYVVCWPDRLVLCINWKWEHALWWTFTVPDSTQLPLNLSVASALYLLASGVCACALAFNHLHWLQRRINWKWEQTFSAPTVHAGLDLRMYHPLSTSYHRHSHVIQCIFRSFYLSHANCFHICPRWTVSIDSERDPPRVFHATGWEDTSAM